MMLCRKIC